MRGFLSAYFPFLLLRTLKGNNLYNYLHTFLTREEVVLVVVVINGT